MDDLEFLNEALKRAELRGIFYATHKDHWTFVYRDHDYASHFDSVLDALRFIGRELNMGSDLRFD